MMNTEATQVHIIRVQGLFCRDQCNQQHRSSCGRKMGALNNLSPPITISDIHIIILMLGL